MFKIVKPIIKSLAAVLAAVLLLGFCGCGREAVPDIDLHDVKAKIISEVPVEGAMDIAADRLYDLYGIAAEDVGSSACFITMSGVFPDEVILVKATDEDAAQRINLLLENKLASFLNQAANYDAESYAVAQKCKVKTNGLYSALFLSSSHEAMEAIYDSYFQMN